MADNGEKDFLSHVLFRQKNTCWYMLVYVTIQHIISFARVTAHEPPGPYTLWSGIGLLLDTQV